MKVIRYSLPDEACIFGINMDMRINFLNRSKIINRIIVGLLICLLRPGAALKRHQDQ
jgi:hypothetical protein